MNRFRFVNNLAIGNNLALYCLPKWSSRCRIFRLFHTGLKPVCICQHRYPADSKLAGAGKDSVGIHIPPVRNYSANAPYAGKITKFLGYLIFGIGHRRKTAVDLYQSLDDLDYHEFYRYFEMPDTFNSWFVVTELHIWMLLTQLMSTERSGYLLRNDIVKSMWIDVEERIKNLGEKKTKVLKKQLKELSGRFPITLWSYDEGLLGSDTILASALWCKFFDKHCDDPEKLEVLVRYIRYQVQELSLLNLKNYENSKDISVKWVGLAEHIKAVEQN